MLIGVHEGDVSHDESRRQCTQDNQHRALRNAQQQSGSDLCHSDRSSVTPAKQSRRVHSEG